MKESREKLEKVAMLVAGWSARGVVDELERDLALRMLQETYSEIKFGVVAKPAAVEVQIAVEPVAEVVAVVPEHEPEPEPVPEVAETAPEPALHVRPHRVAPDVIRSLYGIESETVETREAEPAAVSAPASAPMPTSESEPEPVPAEEPEPVPMSTSEPEPAPVEEQEPVTLPVEEQMTEDDESFGEPIAGDEPKQTSTIAPVPTPAPAPAPAATILGDRLNNGHKTLGEALRSVIEKDMASALAAADCSDLKSAIGLNDRFLMIRDMFSGDAAAFDEAIEMLDGFDDLDSAIIYIHETYDWSADTPGVRLLVEFLERKLGN